MNNRVGPVTLIILCPFAIWLSILLIPQDVSHDDLQSITRAEPDATQASQSKLSQIKPPHSPNPLSNYFEPRPRSVVSTLFFDFDANLAVRDGFIDRQYVTAIDKSVHEKRCFSLNQTNSDEEDEVQEEGEKLFAFNMLASNRVGVFRQIPDTRPPKCPKVEQQHVSSEDLPVEKVSIIICYYNEAPSALLRTIYSILSRSRPEQIKEILVIDDYSEHGYDMDHIKPYITSELVRFVRTDKREGLIRARQYGADLATGDIMIFLDSHIEANLGWLEPLIQTIRQNRTTIACPMIDLINAETMIYSASPMVRGGLTWSLHFKWDSVPSKDLKTADDFAKPIETPTMAGGLYAIDREYFYQLGGYDAGMNLWGGENIELSLRTWMCGGKIVILPCSRMGHIFRKRRPYGPEAGEPDSLMYNSHRSARVWLDQYISKFYAHQPDAAGLDSGDISERLALRERLKCNDFDWYMKVVYPNLRAELESESSETVEEEVPAEKAQLFGTTARSNAHKPVDNKEFT